MSHATPTTGLVPSELLVRVVPLLPLQQRFSSQSPKRGTLVIAQPFMWPRRVLVVDEYLGEPSERSTCSRRHYSSLLGKQRCPSPTTRLLFYARTSFTYYTHTPMVRFMTMFLRVRTVMDWFTGPRGYALAVSRRTATGTRIDADSRHRGVCRLSCCSRAVSPSVYSEQLHTYCIIIVGGTQLRWDGRQEGQHFFG